MKGSLLPLIVSIVLSVTENSYSIEVPNFVNRGEMYKTLLHDYPVLVRDENNSVGVIVENLHNFPSLPETSEVPNSRNILSDSSNPEPNAPIRQVIINLAGVPTLIPLVEYQRKLVERLRDFNKNPVAIFEPSEQTVVTPDDKEARVNLKIAKWKIL